MSDLTNTIGSFAESAVSAVGSAIGSATSSIVGGISEAPSLLESSFSTIGTTIGSLTDVVSNTIGDAAAILDPISFFDSAVSGIGSLTGDLLSGPLTDIGIAIADPALDLVSGIGGFADSVFGGGLVDSISTVISAVPLPLLPLQLLTSTFEKNILSMNSIFDDLFKLDPVAPEYHTQFSAVRVKIGRLSLSDDVINRVLSRMQELTERITRTSLIDSKKEALDAEEDERRRRYNERFNR